MIYFLYFFVSSVTDHKNYLSYISAVTFGAGVQWSEAFDFVEKHRRLVVGSAVTSVGAAGGWVLGGGHSALSSSFGLGIVILICPALLKSLT